MWPFESQGQALARNHVVDRDSLLDEALQIDAFDDKRNEILGSDIATLVDGIKTKKWTATNLVSIYIHAAIRAHRLTNCLTEVNFKYAIQRAGELDDAFSKTGELVGPLHGIPFSLKDQFDLRGTRTTIGYTEWSKKKPASSDCAIAQIAQHHGAIPICKTNVPQTMLSFECNNPYWGRTFNPYNSAHSSGGSSGGEAALLACDGAVFGVGSDIGGSLRIPTQYCGVYALKPSAGRSFPEGGATNLSEGANPLDVVLAPMTRNAADLQLLTALFYTTLNPPADGVTTVREVQRRFGASPRVEAPLRPAWFDPIQAVSQRSPLRRKLRIGYYYCDGMTKTSPACVRAVEMSKSAIQGLKHKDGSSAVDLIEVNPKLLGTARCMQIFAALTSPTGYDFLRKHLGRDYTDPSLYLVMFPAISKVLRGIMLFLVRYIIRDRVMAGILSRIGPRMTRGFWSARTELQEFNRDFEKKVWNDLDLDAIICPVQAIPAIPHRGTLTLSPLAASTILYNIVDCPATVLPVTRVDARLDSHLPQNKTPSYHKWKSTKGFDTCSKMISGDIYKIYNAEKWAGLPVGVQIVTRRGEEELSIGLLKLLDEQLGERGFGPGQLSRKMIKQG